jgi:WD40 repeat protein/tetratricopeptide (TPR) repeat protein/tRNA A-37 threonylcarbamoyl transferase component Bud32
MANETRSREESEEAPRPGDGSSEVELPGFTAERTSVPGGLESTIAEKVCEVASQANFAETQADVEAPVRLRAFTFAAGKGVDRYTLLGEIARGGMGAILKGRDADLGRDLAIKILLDAHKDNPEVVQRFIEEAQIGGQLQHPGIVPVYELGEFVDKRPFFSMKLVKGQALDLLLSQRENPASDRPRFLGIFQQVCQTIAYAHNKHVIHRDLKPANVMVGAFGEVQVMDWGLAKVLGPPGENVGNAQELVALYQSSIHTVRQPNEVGAETPNWQTQPGSALGTPAYMSPEAALGEVEHMDERVDVFGLGAILCEILTGKPPYIASDRKEIFRMAMRGKLELCHERLQASDADRDLIDLATLCLSAEPAARPRHAGVVAQCVSSYLASVESRLKAAEIERAAEAARAEAALHTVAEARAKVRAERAAKRLQLALASVLLVVTSVAWFLADRNAIKQTELTNEAKNAEQWAILQRKRAQASQKRADLTLVEMQTSRGLVAARRNVADEAALWFAEAAEKARDVGDLAHEQPNRLRARNWLSRATVPVAALNLGGAALQLGFQPGGDLLLVRTGRRVLFWNWRDGKLLPWSEGLTDVSAATYSPDGRSIALAFGSGEVQIRSLASGSVNAKLSSTVEPRSLAFSPDGKLVAIGGPVVRLWDVAKNAFLPAKYKHPLPVNALTFNRRGDRLITACDDGKARVFDVSIGQSGSAPLFNPVPHQPSRSSPPALVRDDSTLVTVSSVDQLTTWDMATGKPVMAPLKARPISLCRVVSSLDGQWFASGSQKGLLCAAANPATTFSLEHGNDIWDLKFSPDNTTLLSVSRDQQAKLWSLRTGRQIGQDLPHMGSVELCGWSTDSRNFATAQLDGLIRVWQRPADIVAPWLATGWGQRARVGSSGKLVTPGLWHESPFGFAPINTRRLRVVRSDGQLACDVDLPGFLNDSCMLNGDRSVAAVTSIEGKHRLGIWDLTTNRAVINQPVTLPAMATSLAARPDSAELAVLCCNDDLLLVDGATGKIRKTFASGMKALNPERTKRALYTPDGKSLVVLEYYGPVRVSVRNADTGELRFAGILPCGNDQPNCRSMAISADSRYLATIVNGRNEARVWDLATGRPIGEPIPHPGDDYGLFCVCFSPDGRFLLTGHKDHQLRYWNWRTGELACPAMDQEDEVYDVAITPDGKHAISSSRTPSVVNLWDLESGRLVAPSLAIGSPENNSIETVAISADGHRAYITSRDSLAILDLDAWLKPPDASAADISLLAELTTARRIKAGDLNNLTKEEWQDGWNRLQVRNPGFAHSGVTHRADVIALRSAENAARPSSDFARNGEWSQAAKRAVSSVDADPEDRLKWSSAAAILILAGDLPGYRDLRARMLKRFESTTNPDEADSLFKVALLLPDFAEGPKLPAGVLSKGALNVEGSAEARRWYFAALGLGAYRDHNWERAADLCEKSLENSLRQGADGSLALLILAMARHQEGKHELAESVLAEASDLVPDELATLGTKEHITALPASEFVAHHDWQISEILRREAAMLIHKSAARTTDVSPLVARSLSLLPHDRIEEALADARKAIASSPRSRFAHVLLAVILSKQGKYAEAALECEKEIEFHPRDPLAYWILGEARLAQGNDDEALILANKTLEVDPRAMGAHDLKGRILSNAGKFDEAAQEFLTEIGNNSPRAAYAYSNLGMVRFHQGRPEDAAATYKKAIEQDPETSAPRYMLAQALMATGKLNEAVAESDEALKLAPGDPATTSLRAELMRMQALLPKLDAFVAGTTEPADNTERILLARVCIHRGKFAQGARFYAEAIAADPKLVDNPAEIHALRAATAAARAGQGDGDAGKLDEAERTQFQKQAIMHLRTVLDSVAKALATAELPLRPGLKSLLYRCKANVNLATIREPDQINKLPEDLRDLCMAFWADVDKLLAAAPLTK